MDQHMGAQASLITASIWLKITSKMLFLFLTEQSHNLPTRDHHACFQQTQISSCFECYYSNRFWMLWIYYFLFHVWVEGHGKLKPVRRSFLPSILAPTWVLLQDKNWMTGCLQKLMFCCRHHVGDNVCGTFADWEEDHWFESPTYKYACIYIYIHIPWYTM